MPRTAAVTVLIDRPESDGRARRVRDGHDRRRVVVTETEKARADHLAARLPGVDGMDRVSRAVPEPDRGAVLRFLREMTAALVPGGHRPT